MPNFMISNGYADADTKFVTHAVLSVNSIYYPGVIPAIKNHLRRGGRAYVVMHCCDHSGSTFGNEAQVTVEGDRTTLVPRGVNGYSH